jgi:hypothetical protein
LPLTVAGPSASSTSLMPRAVASGLSASTHSSTNSAIETRSAVVVGGADSSRENSIS